MNTPIPANLSFANVVIWKHEDGRIVLVFPEHKLGLFPPGYYGSSDRHLASIMFRLPTGYTESVLWRSSVPSFDDRQWEGIPGGGGSGWIRVQR